MRWTLLAALVVTANACVRSVARDTVDRPHAVVSKESLASGRPRAPAAAPTAAAKSPPPPEPNPPASRSWLANAGACLEPLEPVYSLSGNWIDHVRTLELDGDALFMLVTAPAFRAPHALSLHRRSGGIYFLRVTGISPSGSRPSKLEGAVDRTTARLVLKLWGALASRVQIVETEEGSFDGKAYYFSNGNVTGYAANPREGSVLDRTIFALDWLANLVEEPASEDASDLHFIREELRDALARTFAEEPCVRAVSY